MKNPLIRRLAAGIAVCASAAFSTAHANPDVIVGDLIGISSYGTPSSGEGAGTIYGYAVGTTSCNIGTSNLLWISSTNQHPVIAQNMYRLSTVDGATRFEQVGQSWLKHGFTALTQSLCNTCSGQGGSVLGVGCSDPYSSGLNGGQSRLGPRSEVNATTGVFTYPYQLQWQRTGNQIFKRLQVKREDINPAQNTGSLYFVEGHYITQDDHGAGNALNNASYRRVTVSNNSTFSVSNASGSTTQRTKPAIYAWKDHGLGLNQSDPAVEIKTVDVPGDGRFFVGSKVTDLGNGMWRYEYAVFNLTSHRSGAGVEIPAAAGVNVTNIGFRDVDYHSGEPYDNTDWTMTRAGGTVAWNSPQTFDQNANSNALRWSTMYNFRFDADVPPVTGEGSLRLFRPGTPDTVSFSIPVPSAPACPSDWDQSGGVDGDDITSFFVDWQAGEADIDQSGGTDGDDIPVFFGFWQAGC